MPTTYPSSPITVHYSFHKRYKSIVQTTVCGFGCTILFLFLLCNAIITLLRPVAPDLCIEFQEHCTFTPIPVDIVHPLTPSTSSSSSSSSTSSAIPFFDPRLLQEFSVLYLQSSIGRSGGTAGEQPPNLPFPRTNNTYTRTSILYDHPLIPNTFPSRKQKEPFTDSVGKDNHPSATNVKNDNDEEENTAHIVLYIHGHHGHPTQASALATLLQAKMTSMVKYPRIELFTTDFQSTSSAFHRGLIQAQAYYVNTAIQSIRKYLLGEKNNDADGPTIETEGSTIPPRQRYRKIGKVIILAHSMGNVAARAAFLATNYIPGSINMIISLNGPSIAHPYSVDYDYVTLFTRMAQLWTSTITNTIQDDTNHGDDPYSSHTSHAKVLDDLVYISISGGGGDSTIRPELTVINNILPSTHGFSIHTMSIPGVWLHTSHDGIVNCGQFTAKLVDILIMETLPIHETILMKSLTTVSSSSLQNNDPSFFNKEESLTHQRTQRLRYLLTDYMFQNFFATDKDTVFSSSLTTVTDAVSPSTIDYLLEFPVLDNNYVNVGPNAELLVNFSTLDKSFETDDEPSIPDKSTVTPMGCVSISRIMNNPTGQQGLSILTNIPLYRDLQIYVRVQAKEEEQHDEATGCRILDYTFPCQKGTITKSTSLPYWNVRSHLHGSWDGIPLNTLEQIGIDVTNEGSSTVRPSPEMWSTFGRTVLLIPIYIHGYIVGLFQRLGLSVQDPLFPYTSLTTTYPYQPLYTSSSSFLRQGYDWTQGLVIDTMVPRHIHNHDPYGSIAITSVGTLHLYSLNIDTRLLYNGDPAIDICLVTEMSTHYYNPEQYSYSYSHMNQEEKNHEESVFTMVQLDSPLNHELVTENNLFTEPLSIPEGHSLSLRYILNRDLSPYATYRVIVQRQSCRTMNKNSNTTEYELFLPILHYSVMQKNTTTQLYTLQPQYESFMLQPSAGSWLYNDRYYQYHKKISTSTFHATEISEEFTVSEIAEIQYSFTIHTGFAEGTIVSLTGTALYPVLTFVSDTQCAYTVQVYEDWTGAFGQWIHHHTGWSVTALFSIVLFILSAQIRKLEAAQRKYLTSRCSNGKDTHNGSPVPLLLSKSLLQDYIPKYLSIRTAFIDNYLWLCIVFVIQGILLPTLSIHNYIIPRMFGTSAGYTATVNSYPSMHDILQAYFFALSGACTILYLGPKILYGVMRCCKCCKFPECCRLCCYRNSTMVVGSSSSSRYNYPYDGTNNSYSSHPIVPKFVSRNSSSATTPTPSAPGTPNRYTTSSASSLTDTVTGPGNNTVNGTSTGIQNNNTSTLRRKILSGTNLTNDSRSNSFTASTNNGSSMNNSMQIMVPSSGMNPTTSLSGSFSPRALNQFSAFGTNEENTITDSNLGLPLSMDIPPSIERTSVGGSRTLPLYTVSERTTSPSGRRKRKTSSWAEDDLEVFLAEHGNPNAFYHHSTSTPSPHIYHSPLESPAPPPLFSISPPIRLHHGNRLEIIDEIASFGAPGDNSMDSPARTSIINNTYDDENHAKLPFCTTDDEQYRFTESLKRYDEESTVAGTNTSQTNDRSSSSSSSSSAAVFTVPNFIRKYDRSPSASSSSSSSSSSPSTASPSVEPSHSTSVMHHYPTIDTSYNVSSPSLSDYRIISIPRLLYAIFRFCLFGDPIQTYAYYRVSSSSGVGIGESSTVPPTNHTSIGLSVPNITNNLANALNTPSGSYAQLFGSRYADLRIFMNTQWTLFRRWIAVCYTAILVHGHQLSVPLVRMIDRWLVRMKAISFYHRYKPYLKPLYTIGYCLFCTLPRLPIQYTAKLGMYSLLIVGSYFLPWLSVLGAYVTLLVVTFINYCKYTGILPIYIRKVEVAPLARIYTDHLTTPSGTNPNTIVPPSSLSGTVSPSPPSRTTSARILLNSLLHYQITILLLYSALIGIKAMSVIYSIEVVSLWYHKYIWLHPFHRDIGLTLPITLHLLSALYDVPMGSISLLPEQVYTIMMQIPTLVRYKIHTLLVPSSSTSTILTPPASSVATNTNGFSLPIEIPQSSLGIHSPLNNSNTVSFSSFVYSPPNTFATKGLFYFARIVSWCLSIPLHTIIAILAWSIFAVAYQELYRIIYYVSFIAVIMVTNISMYRLLRQVYIPTVPSITSSALSSSEEDYPMV